MKRFLALSIIILVLCCTFTSCKSNDLVNALKSGNLERVKEAIDNGADVNKVSLLYGPSASPLLYSMRNGQRCIPEYLLSKGADPNFIDNKGISILMYTVGASKESGLQYGNVTDNDNYITLLNDKRTDINLTGKLGYTALDYACRDNGILTIVNTLIKHGAKITSTTMKCAIEGYKNGNCEETVLKLVFDSLKQQKIPSGLEPDIEASIQGDSSKLISFIKDGKVKQGNKQIDLILTCAFGNVETFKALAGENIDFNKKFYNKTYLGVACSYGKLEMVEYLLSKGANLEWTTYEDYSALTAALEFNRIDIADILIRHGAKLQIAESGTTGARPDDLESACINGNINTIKWIVKHGYPLTKEHLLEAMTKAAQDNHINVLQYFINDLKADINVEFYDSTVLSNCTGISSLKTIKFLIDNGANINGGKNHVMTPLDSAVNSNRADIVKYLIDKGADVNLIGHSDDGLKPSSLLTQAIQNGYFDIVKILVENGADLHYKEGWSTGKDTPLEIAKKEKSQHIIDYLRSVQRDK